MKKLALCFVLLGSVFCRTWGQPADDLDLSAFIHPVDSSAFVRDAGYYHWCNSFIKDDLGTYHLFYSRWPKSLGFTAWLTHSEIAHATASRLEGPYRYQETVLKGRTGSWDAVTAHNVQVRQWDNRFYLYYTSTNTGEENWSDSFLKEVARVGYSHARWNDLRNRQRAGVAVSSSLNGPWKRAGHPLLEPNGPIEHVAVNPSVCRGEDGKFVLIIKGDDVRSEKRRLIQAVGTGTSPLGPFTLSDKPAFADIPTEDVFVWFDPERKRYYAIFHAHGGDFIGLITSADGINWEKARHYVVCKKQIPLKDGTVMKVDNMERPFVFLENGKPVMLSFAVKKGADSFIVMFAGKADSAGNRQK